MHVYVCVYVYVHIGAQEGQKKVVAPSSTAKSRLNPGMPSPQLQER